jgi:rubrerythrin
MSGEDTRRLLERVLRYEVESAEMYDRILGMLRNEKVRARMEGLRDAELRHEEMVRKELRRFK